MMLRALYSALWYPATPLIKHYLRKRARRSPQYAEYWDERFGAALTAPVQGALWIHAVSVGETRAAVPLVEALRRRFPDAPLLLTQMTPTGRAAAEALFPDAQCRYLPYDRPDWVARFLRDHRPLAGILMETEIWPNLLHACRRRQVPVFLANARLSEKSLRGYRRVRRLIAPALAQLSGCFAQTGADAARLHAIGAPSPEVCGNTKYDLPPEAGQIALGAEFRARFGGRPAVLAASTRRHRGCDEAMLVLQAWRAYRGEALLVVVPRHPENFQAAFDAAVQLGFRVQKRSDNRPVAAGTQVWIGDSMGEMTAYYTAAEAVFVGGSLVDTGCQNIIEPLACGRPVLFGPSVYNFQAACEAALAAGAAEQVADAAELAAAFVRLLADSDLRRSRAAQAGRLIRDRQGASARIAAAVAHRLQAA